MKETNRDEWRVIATVYPMQTKMTIASLGFKDIYGDPLQGQVWGEAFTLTLLPQRLGDFGGMFSMSDTLASRDVEGDYEARCKVIRDGVLQHPNVIKAEIVCNETHTCSFCGSQWEELTTRSEVKEFGQEDGLSVAGEPVCCLEAINEFRAGRGIAPCST